jgi:hypothetical protein
MCCKYTSHGRGQSINRILDWESFGLAARIAVKLPQVRAHTSNRVENDTNRAVLAV